MGVSEAGAIPAVKSHQDLLYEQAACEFGPALERLTRAYEAEPETPSSDLLVIISA